MQKNKTKNNNGFSLIEILLAISIFALVVMGSISAILYAEQAQVNASQKNQAVALAESTLEIVRSIRDQVFSDSAPHCNDPCGLRKDSDGNWNLIDSNFVNPSDYYDSSSGLYRGIVFRPYRDVPVDGRDVSVWVSPNGDFSSSYSLILRLGTRMNNWQNGMGVSSSIDYLLNEIKSYVEDFYSQNGTYVGAFDQDQVSEVDLGFTGSELMENVTVDAYAFYVEYQGSYYCLDSNGDDQQDGIPPTGTTCGE